MNNIMSLNISNIRLQNALLDTLNVRNRLAVKQ